MRAGTNVQARLIALHHLDAPWRPRGIEQREGRILRQGNGNTEVRMFRCVTEGSFDACMWQTLETKARFIAQVTSGHTSVRCAEDLETGALTYAEIEAIASGNPIVIEKVKVDTESARLTNSVPSTGASNTKSIGRSASYPHASNSSAGPWRRPRPTSQHATDTRARSSRSTVGNRVFTGKGAREEAAKALNAVVISWPTDSTFQVRAAFRGLQIASRGTQSAVDPMPTLFVQGAGTYGAHFNPASPLGTIQSIEHTIRNLEAVRADRETQLTDAIKMLEDLRGQATRPFEHEARLTELLARQAELHAALDLEKGDQQAAPEADTATQAA